MPDIMKEFQNVASGSETHCLEDGRPWKFRFCPYTKGRYTIGIGCDGAAKGMEWEVKIGTTEIVQRSAMTIGLTEGVIPTPYGAAATNTAPFVTFDADKDDEVDVIAYETGAVATTDIMLWASVIPLIP